MSERLRILYDHQAFEMQRFGGITRYFYELLLQFDKDSTLSTHVPLRCSNNAYIQGYLPDLKPVLTRRQLAKKILNLQWTGPSGAFSYWNKVMRRGGAEAVNKALTIEALRKGDFDVFHPTYYDTYFLEHIGSKPYVVTVHDLIHQLHPEFFIGEKIMDKTQELFDRASEVIAISASTKKDLMRFFNVAESKITVIHHGASPLVAAQKPSLPLPERYLLFVGQRTRYKNFHFLANAFAAIAEQYPDVHLVCTGHPFDAEELSFFDSIGLRNRMHQVSASDAELVYLYSHATAFVFPSLYEGFGMPVLEAFQQDCPVLLSKASSFPEVGGDAVIYFDPADPASLRQALRHILTEGDQLQAQRRQQLQQFSWEKAAAATRQVYKKAMRH